MEAPILIYTTFDHFENGKSAAQTLVQEKLAICANILPIAHAVYLWEGKVEESTEVPVLFKTTQEKLSSFMERLLKLHPYVCPAIWAWPVPHVPPAISGWLEEELG